MIGGTRRKRKTRHLRRARRPTKRGYRGKRRVGGFSISDMIPGIFTVGALLTKKIKRTKKRTKY